MKRFFAAVLTLLLILQLAACGNKPGKTSEAETTRPVSTEAETTTQKETETTTEEETTEPEPDPFEIYWDSEFAAMALDRYVYGKDYESLYESFGRDVTIADVTEDPETGSRIRIEPSETMSFHVEVDFNSHVLGVQTAHWDETADYASQIADCRTFVFFHEVQFLASQGLVKGGDVDNAIVVVEHPVDDATVAHMAELFNQPKLSVTPEGYLSNLVLNFPDECGRHKLLDLIGDIRLAGGYLRAHISAYKPGHTINTNAAKAVQKLI